MCTALQVALVELLRSWDIFPSAVLGHSSGEIAAAYTAGGLSRESAWKVAFYRGSLSARIIATGDQERGTMMAVDLSENEAEIYLRRNKIDQNVTIGCVNSPRNITLTGSEAEIDRLKPLLERDGIQARKLQVNVAYHSPYMEMVSGEYRRLIHNIKPRELSPRNPDLFSSLTGGLISVDQCSNPEYWTQNLVSKVRFRDALSQMCSKSRNVSKEDKPIEIVIEIGPHAVLRRPVKETLADTCQTGIKYYSMLERGTSARHTSLQVTGSLFCSGYPVDLRTINHYNVKSSNLRMLVDLPEYPFNHNQKYWVESRVSDGFRFRHRPRNELLGTPSSDWNPLQACWRNFIRASEIPWIRDHKV